MKLNLPNKLTMFRICLVPIFVIFLLGNIFGILDKYIAASIFGIACLTDFFDGTIARKYNMITNFGKFIDPLADKILVCSALICFTELGVIPSWIVIIIISREFIISGFRLMASTSGIVIAASWWGKYKTVCQMIMTILIILDFNFSWYTWLVEISIYLSLVLTIISLIDYIIKNKKVLLS